MPRDEMWLRQQEIEKIIRQKEAQEKKSNDSLAEHGAEGRNGGDVRLGELQYALEQGGDLGWTLAAIVTQESSLCRDKHWLDPNSWGCGQLTVPTAKSMDPSATAAKLMADDAYNIRLASAYLHYCHRLTHSWQAMVRCYHGKTDPAYIEAIRTRLRWLLTRRRDDT